MNWRQVKKLALSGKALWTYATLVLATAGGIYGHLNNWGFQFPALVLKHELPSHLTPLLQRELPAYLTAFGKQHVDPLGVTTKQALDRINELKIDLTAANGRNEALQIQIVNLNDNVKRLVTITDRLLDRLARSSISSSPPIPTTTPLAGDAR